MTKKGRGRDSSVVCASCGRSVPRNKAVEDIKRITYSTELKSKDDVTYSESRKLYYCISCGKHRGIFEKKKKRFLNKYNK